ncbi:unnamed protein product [Blepharisma stoltei]|uniref:DUF7646 domain-containing protein n=1 Tax=Blepharisma stoltei TaxID=1481888 RepID=A0AAU9K6T6_9CILI|nr:unnamed protein product [Blepharisma stoltei]
MEDFENRPKAEKYFPQADATLEGAQSKMQFLQENTEIAIGIPLRHQIYSLLQLSDQGGLTVQEVSKKLCLNTKTCAKVLDEMVSKYPDIKATAHRYGRVFVHKYHISQKQEEKHEKLLEDEEYLTQVNQDTLDLIKKTECDYGKTILKAIEVNVKADRRPTNRQRVTHQTYIRSLFIVSRIQTLKVSSIYEMKEMIKSDLEPNAKWSLDKKTVLRIVWKLQGVGLIRQMCFRITLKKNDEHDLQYLGDEYGCIEKDKKVIKLNGTTDARGNTVLYKVIIALPNMCESDPLVLAYPLLQNPTNRKPIATPGYKLPSSVPIFSKSIYLKKFYQEDHKYFKKIKEISAENFIEIVKTLYKCKGELEKKDEKIEDDGSMQIEDEEVPEVARKAINCSVFIKWAEEFHRKWILKCYEIFIGKFRVSSTYLALKSIQNSQKKDTQINNKLSLAYGNISFKPANIHSFTSIPEKLFNNPIDEKMDIDEKLLCSSTSSDANENNGDGEIFEEQLKEIRKNIDELNFLKHRKLPKKRKGGVVDAAATIKKVFLTLENKPMMITIEQIDSLTKKLDVEPTHFLSYLQMLGIISECLGKFKVNPPWMWMWWGLHKFIINSLLKNLTFNSMVQLPI